MPVSVKVGGVWKTATSVYNKVGGVWKTASDMPVKVGGAWKTGILTSAAFESIATVTLTSTQSSITFSSIPSTYTHLQLRYSGLSNNMGTQFMEINGDTSTANYRTHFLVGNGTTASGGDLFNRAAILGGGFGGQFNTTYPMVGIVDFLDYTNTAKFKTVRGLHGTDTNNTGYNGEVELVSGLWRSGSPITQIRFYLDGGMNFIANTRYALYGIKSA